MFLYNYSFSEDELLKCYNFIEKKVKLYLKRVGKFNSDSLYEEFRNYNNYYQFAHTTADDDELTEKHIKIINSTDHIPIKDTNVVILNKFIFDLINLLGELFTNLLI